MIPGTTRRFFFEGDAVRDSRTKQTGIVESTYTRRGKEVGGIRVRLDDGTLAKGSREHYARFDPPCKHQS